MVKTKSLSPLSKFSKIQFLAFGLFVIGFGLFGVKTLTDSHAATLQKLGFYNYTSAATTNTNVFTTTDAIPGIGNQSVSDIAPGGNQLVYNFFPGKLVAATVCYQVRIYNSPKAATQVNSASVKFVGYGNALTVTLPVDSDYHQICVPKGNKAQLSYNVANLAAKDSSAYVLVYQAFAAY